MSNWQDCVVSYFDLIEIREKINSETSEASILMQNFHLFVRKNIFDSMPTHDHAYVWNDSALFLAFPKNDSDYEIIMRELNTLKPKLDRICTSYGICIKGQAIPDSVCRYDIETKWQSRFVFLKASSYALANCFKVEEKLKELEMDWYIDSRIADKIPNFPDCDQHPVSMLPSGDERNVYVLKGSIWNSPNIPINQTGL